MRRHELAEQTIYDTEKKESYRLRTRVGSGGQADVYSLSGENAIKIFDPNPTAEQLEAIEQEAAIALALNHDYILPTHAFGSGTIKNDLFPYIVMSRAEGSLRDLMTKNHPDIARSVEILANVSDGLHYAHENAKKLHRDIKPENILILPDGRSVVADFGIAATLHDKTTRITTQALAFSPPYMSPEHGTRNARRSSDIYSLGVVAFELVTGRLPFERDSPTEYIQAHFSEAPPTFESILASSMNRTLERLEEPVQKALAKDIKARQESAEEFREEIETALVGGKEKEGRTIIDVAIPEKTLPYTHLPDEEQYDDSYLDEDLAYEEEEDNTPRVRPQSYNRMPESLRPVVKKGALVLAGAAVLFAIGSCTVNGINNLRYPTYDHLPVGSDSVAVASDVTVTLVDRAGFDRVNRYSLENSEGKSCFVDVSAARPMAKDAEWEVRKKCPDMLSESEANRLTPPTREQQDEWVSEAGLNTSALEDGITIQNGYVGLPNVFQDPKQLEKAEYIVDQKIDLTGVYDESNYPISASMVNLIINPNVKVDDIKIIYDLCDGPSRREYCELITRAGE